MKRFSGSAYRLVVDDDVIFPELSDAVVLFLRCVRPLPGIYDAFQKRAGLGSWIWPPFDITDTPVRRRIIRNLNMGRLPAAELPPAIMVHPFILILSAIEISWEFTRRTLQHG